jgi:glutamine synthetase
MSNPRQQAVRSITATPPVAPVVDYTRRQITEVFGENVFTVSAMKEKLPKEAFRALQRTLQHGEPLDVAHADAIAVAMKDWATARGATHFTHWFQPMTGSTAEKHDAFINYASDGRAITEFSGKLLIQGEPDASSFPSGGIRATFEARGYTAWDPTSPAFLMEGTNGKTLCIPTAFCSYTGEALDEKTPLLRSLQALDKQAVRLLRVMGNKEVSRVTSTVGPEQEYFLVDRNFYWLRPDLINAGRTLFGARPPKGQEMEDHYFGSIRPRVLAFMMEAEYELYRLGIPIKTRHNEVAPAQFEIAPVFERGNVAVDHNMLVMETLRGVANRHGLVCLLHEKPFAGINGSGKHNNWSLVDDHGNNLLEPGHTPGENAQFLVVLTAVIRAVNKHGALLRAAIASAGNDHRLGANEAPPAILSVYLGEQLTDVVQGLIAGTKPNARGGRTLDIGVTALPPLPRDASDRNRTSPFAFTGNKFEFRAVGSSMSIARPNTFLNTIVADSLDWMATAIESAKQKGASLHDAVQKVVQDALAENQRILFAGDNYSPDWYLEAEKRGLPNLKNTPDAVDIILAPESRELFTKHGVYATGELESRHTVMLETYIKTLNIESLLAARIAKDQILPAALRYQKELAESIVRTREASPKANVQGAVTTLDDLAEQATKFRNAIDALDRVRHDAEALHGDVRAQGRHYRDKVLPAMAQLREVGDILEHIVDDGLWPLPKYREMLFVY